MTCVVFGFVLVPCRAAPDLTDAPCRALCEQAGRGYVDDHQRDHHSRWLGQLCQASNLFRFVRGSRQICLLGRSDMGSALAEKLPRRRSSLIFSIHPSPGP
jgi:hypothetical protein